MAALNTLYDGELKNVDDYLAQLLTSLDDQELKDNTVVILTGDHGEAIGDRGSFGHGARLWEVFLRVPLIVRDFRVGKVGRQIDEPVGVLDIMPTVLDLVGAAPLEQVQGRSFAPALNGDPIETHTYFAEINNAPKTRIKPWFDTNTVAVWSWPFKLEMFKDKHQLFDLVQDPLAEKPISHDQNPGVYEYLLDEAEAYLAKQISKATSGSS